MQFLAVIRKWKSDLIPTIPAGYVLQPVKYSLDVTGKNWSIAPLRENEKGRTESVLLPEPFLYRGGAPVAGFIDERAEYVLGLTDRPAKTKKYAEDYLSLLEMAAKETRNRPLKIVRRFLSEKWNSADRDFLQFVKQRKMFGSDWVTVRYQGERLADMKDLQEWWLGRCMQGVEVSEKALVCGVCGERKPIPLRGLLRLMLPGSQSKAPLGSANEKHLEAYNFKCCENTPICFDCSRQAYDAANILFRSPKHALNLGRTATQQDSFLAVWADQGEAIDFDPLFAGLRDDPVERAERLLDAVQRIRTNRVNTANLDTQEVHSITAQAQRGGVRLTPVLSTTTERMAENILRFAAALKNAGKITWGLWSIGAFVYKTDEFGKRQLALDLFYNAVFGLPLRIRLLPNLLRRTRLAANLNQRAVLRFLFSIVLRGERMNAVYKLGRQVGIVVQLSYAVHRSLHGTSPASVEADCLINLPPGLLLRRLVRLREMNLRRLRAVESGLAGWYAKRLSSVNLTEAETAEVLRPLSIEEQAWFASGFLAERDSFAQTEAESEPEKDLRQNERAKAASAAAQN